MIHSIHNVDEKKYDKHRLDLWVGMYDGLLMLKFTEACNQHGFRINHKVQRKLGL